MPYKIAKVLILALSTIGVMAPCTAVVAAVMSDAAAVETERQIVATGSSRAQRRFDASFAVNSLFQEEVRRTALKNAAELLGIMLSSHVEATSGEWRIATQVDGGPASPWSNSAAATANKT